MIALLWKIPRIKGLSWAQTKQLSNKLTNLKRLQWTGNKILQPTQETLFLVQLSISLKSLQMKLMTKFKKKDILMTPFSIMSTHKHHEKTLKWIRNVGGGAFILFLRQNLKIFCGYYFKCLFLIKSTTTTHITTFKSY